MNIDHCKRAQHPSVIQRPPLLRAPSPPKGYKRCTLVVVFTAISRKVVGKNEKNRKKSRKVIWDMSNFLFPTLSLSNLLLLLSFSTRRHTSVASRCILSNFFEKQCTQNHPQYLSGLSRALYPTTFLEIAVFK